MPKNKKSVLRAAGTPKGFAIMATIALTIVVGGFFLFSIQAATAKTFVSVTYKNKPRGTYKVCFKVTKGTTGGFNFNAIYNGGNSGVYQYFGGSTSGTVVDKITTRGTGNITAQVIGNSSGIYKNGGVALC